jgi:2-polyprenyl-6-methoxyphenol hydroxylase-like FAD-dependent oxidoreductase
MTTPSEPNPETAVVVVGAGPVGLLAACELARRHVSVRVIDKLSTATPQSRAILVLPRSLEMLDQVGVLEQMTASGVKSRAMELCDGARLLVRMDLDSVDSPFPFAITTAQTETERILSKRLRDLGVDVERGLDLTAAEQNADGVTSTVRGVDGGTATIRSSFVLGADGGHSAVRDAMGSRLVGSFRGERFILADVEADHDLQQDTMRTYFSSSEGPLLAFPMKGHRLRLFAEVSADGPAADPTLDELRAIVAARTGGIRVRTSHWLTTFDVRHAQVPNYRIGRMFLAGDAAHIHSPAGGQGMNTGMQDAFNLGWKLASVLQGQGGELLLDSYNTERHPVAAKMLKLTTRMTKIGTLDNGVARWLRNEALHAASAIAPIRHAIANQIDETDVAYRDSPVIAHQSRSGRSRHLRPGDHFPGVAGTSLRHNVVTDPDGGQGETGHVLVTVCPDGAGAIRPVGLPGVRDVLVHAPGHPLDDSEYSVADPDGHIAARLDMPHGGRVLVRPDGYVGAITGLEAAAALDAYLHLLAA